MTTFFRLPDLMTIASEEDEHDISGPSEFTVIIKGVILHYDDLVLCGKCNYPNRGEDKNCVACKEDLTGLERIRFWRLAPDMQNVELSLEPFSSGPIDEL